MAAYAALVSVMHILDNIEQHQFPQLSHHKQQLDSLTRDVDDLQEFLQGYNPRVSNNNDADPLEMRIADAAYAAEDVIESYVVDLILAGAKSDGQTINQNMYDDLQKVIDEMDSIKKEVKKVVAEKAAVRDQLSVSPSASSSVSSSFGQQSTMVGNDEVLLEIMDKLTNDELSNRQVIPIVGMGGIGKTTLARNIYAHQLIIHRFDILAWVTISQEFDTKELLCQLVSQANKEVNRTGLSKMSEDEVGLILHKSLSHRRFLIVLDDMWSIEAWDEIQRYFPDNGNSSRIMVTTRLSNLGLDNSYGVDMNILDEVSSWNLFSKIVFGGRNCPPNLEMIGVEIVKKCRGLPLSIVVMGGILQKVEHTIECWESISQNLTASTMNSKNNEQCLKILKMSYNYLPIHLKPCFLFMGVYEEDTIIRVSEMINLWVSEGFLSPVSSKSLETVGKEYLKELVDRRLVQVDEMGSTGNIKYCKMHDLFRDVSLKEAEKERFYHVVGRHSLEGARNQRRIVVMRSASEKEVHEAAESMPHARSCICVNTKFAMFPNSRLLRTFKAYMRFTEKNPRMNPFANVFFSGFRLFSYGLDRDPKFHLRKTFEFVNLRYLFVGAGHSPGHNDFPSTVGLLWNLQTLVVGHSRELQAPAEIWKMPQLRHVHFCRMGLLTFPCIGSLPDPSRDKVVIMKNLQTLTGVRNLKFSEEVVRRIPNIKKLGIYYESNYSLVQGIGVTDYYCVANLERLEKLESLACHVEIYDSFRVCQNLSFPLSLRKLGLWNLRLSDDMMEKIGSLPVLQKLKLVRGDYFNNGKWKTVGGQFRSLKSLSLNSPKGLKEWVMEDSSHFPCLEKLSLYDAINLEEIPAEIGEIPTLQTINIAECIRSVVESALKIVEQQQELQGDQPSFHVYIWKDSEVRNLENLSNPNIHLINL